MAAKKEKRPNPHIKRTTVKDLREDLKSLGKKYEALVKIKHQTQTNLSLEQENKLQLQEEYDLLKEGVEHSDDVIKELKNRNQKLKQQLYRIEKRSKWEQLKSLF